MKPIVVKNSMTKTRKQLALLEDVVGDGHNEDIDYFKDKLRLMKLRILQEKKRGSH